MKPIELDLDLANVDADGIADGNDSSGTSVDIDGVLTLNGSFTSADGLGRIISITDSSTSDQSDVTFTLTGTDPSGEAISEDITGPASAATVVSTKHFKTLMSITISAAQGGSETVDVGTVATTLSASSKPIPLNYRNDDAVVIDVDITGTINYTIYETFDDLVNNKDKDGNVKWTAISAFSAKTADVNGRASVGARGLKAIVNSYTDAAEMQVTIIHLDRY